MSPALLFCELLAVSSAFPNENRLLKAGSQVYRDVIAACEASPFLTDADVRIYFTDTRGRIATSGGQVRFHYPGMKQVLLRGEPLSAWRSGPNLIEVQMPAGVHDVEVKASSEAAATDLPAGFDRDGAVDSVDRFTARARTLKPGDELVVKNGVYINWGNVAVSASGTSDKPILVRPETPGGVVFRRRTQIHLKGKHVVIKGFRFEQAGPSSVLYLSEGEHLRVTQCQFSGCGDPQSTYAHIVRLGPHCHRSRVDHCFFTGSKSMSIGLRIVDQASAGMDNLIDHNVFRDIYRYAGNGQENIQLGGGDGEIAPRCTVEYCVFDHAWGDSEIISNKSSGNVIRYNVAAHCLFSAFTLRQGDDVRFEGNVMVNNGDGVRVFGKRHVIANNLFMDIRGSGVILQTGDAKSMERAPATEALIAHNTFLNCLDVSVCSEWANATYPLQVQNTRVVNNLLTGVRGFLVDLSGAANSRVERSLVWTGQHVASGHRGQDVLSVDPRLENAGVYVRPALNSPVVDQGLPLAQVRFDRWQRPRTDGSAPDLGADELGRGDPPRDMLPEIPPPPLLLPSLYKKELVYPSKPTPAGATLAPTGTATTLVRDLPQDFVLEWDHLPGSWSARASLTFATEGNDGYTISWGGEDGNGVPNGIVELRRNPTGEVVADAADILHHRMDYRQGDGSRKPSPPRPADWYSFTLIKRGDCIWLALRPRWRFTEVPVAPVIVWRGAGLAEPARVLRIGQTETGTWRNVYVWSCGAASVTPPPDPKALIAEGLAKSRVRLRWRHGTAGRVGVLYEVYRHTNPSFTHSPANRVAAGVSGESFDDFDVQPRTTYTYRVRARNVLGLTSDFASAQTTTPADGWLYLYLNAASAAQLISPFVLRTDPVTGDTYLTTLSYAGSPTQGPVREGLAAYEFRVPKQATYVLWGLAQAPDASSDSFYLALDAQALDRFFSWGVPVQDTWEWRAIRRVDLSVGKHTLYVKHREDGAMLKALLLTGDLSYQPAHP